MKSIDINGTLRTETGKKATKLARKEGLVPCNLYGEARGENGLPVALSFTVTASGLRNLVYTPEIYSVNLDIDGKKYTAVMRELQFHPVTDQLLHIDFYEITENGIFVVAFATNGGIERGDILLNTQNIVYFARLHIESLGDFFVGRLAV